MRYFLLLLLIAGQSAMAQSDEKIIEGLKKSINYLADDKLEGRRTGTPGEKLAYEFIIGAFKKNGVGSFKTNKDYLQAFEVNDGRQVDKASFKINKTTLKLNDDFIPMAYSGNADSVKINDIKDAVLFNIDAIITANKDNPHFDLKENIITEAKEAVKRGRKIFFLLTEEAGNDSLIQFDKNEKAEKVNIPVVYLKRSVLSKIDSKKTGFEVELSFKIIEKKRIGHNVVGQINNNASQTIIIGAHYDHLGYGEDHNSLYAGSTPMIHNGADDNASGTAALIELSRVLQNSSVKKYNYVFVAFSGEELGLYGSKYFTEHSPVDLKQVDYMINMDMVGRLNDSTHGITIGGFATSPIWAELIHTDDSYFKIKFDSSGVGPSDHTSFYRKDIPVLFFFTGTHKDYHKPSDDADKINYSGELHVVRYIASLIEKTAVKDKPVFTKTKESSMGKTAFKVTMGIMPDYTFSGAGVMVDGVSDGRPASKAGIKPGDVILQLGDYPVSDVQTYMQALNKFNKGEPTKVKIKRLNETLVLDVTF